MANLRYLNDSIEKFKHLNHVIKSGFDITSRVGEDVESEAAKKLRDVMVQYAAMGRDIKNRLKAAEEAKREFERDLAKDNQHTPDFYGNYEEKLATLQAKDTPDQLEEHKGVKDYDATIMKQHFGEESQDEASPMECDDEEIQMTQPDITQRYICPITKVELVDPVNNVCGHVYSRDAIKTHIRNNKNRDARCPVAGCVHLVTRDSIEEDTVLAYEIRQKHKNN